MGPVYLFPGSMKKPDSDPELLVCAFKIKLSKMNINKTAITFYPDGMIVKNRNAYGWWQ